MSRPGRESARLTREGRGTLALAVLVALAALNTGANLLFLILSLLAGLLMVAWIAGRGVLAAAVVELRVPELMEAGRVVPGALGLRVASPQARTGASRGRTGGVAIRLRAALLLPPEGAYLELAAAECASGVSPPVRFQAPGRGLYRSLPILLSTRAPFGLVQRTLERDVPVRLAVHPRLRPRGRPRLGIAAEGPGESHQRGDGASLRNLRPYVPGDNPRHLHWRASARTGALMVREFAAEVRPAIVVAVESGAPGAAFEEHLSEAASTLRDALLDGHRVELRVPGERHLFGRASDLPRALRLFARLEPHPGEAVR